MTKLLELAIAELRKLPPEEQDEAAEMLLWAIETRSGSIPLDDETIAAIEEGLAEARCGESPPTKRSPISGSGTRADPLRVAHRPDFKAYLIGGPKIDDFSIDRDRDASRPVEF